MYEKHDQPLPLYCQTTQRIGSSQWHCLNEHCDGIHHYFVSVQNLPAVAS